MRLNDETSSAAKITGPRLQVQMRIVDFWKPYPLLDRLVQRKRTIRRNSESFADV
jgi:hypothetical protein